MIASRTDLREYLAADLHANSPHQCWRFWHRYQNPVLAWMRQLRRLEYRTNTKRGYLWKIYLVWARYRFRCASIRLGFSIPPNVFGPGLAIVHWGTIVVNEDARVGASCRVHPGVCLGKKNGKAPVVGDDCYLGPGAKLVGGVVLGDRVAVGANAVVTHSFGDGAVLAGVPAQDIRSQSGGAA
jgi:serine O-acetyltransferase